MVNAHCPKRTWTHHIGEGELDLYITIIIIFIISNTIAITITIIIILIVTCEGGSDSEAAISEFSSWLSAGSPTT